MISILQAMPCCESTRTFLTQDNIRFLSTLGNVVWNTRTSPMSPEEFREALADMDVCVCGWNTPRLDAYVLGKANRLKLVAYTAGSVAKVATDDMYDRGIRIVSGNEAFAQSVAEGTMAYMLASLRRLGKYQQYMADTRLEARGLPDAVPAGEDGRHRRIRGDQPLSDRDASPVSGKDQAFFAPRHSGRGAGDGRGKSGSGGDLFLLRHCYPALRPESCQPPSDRRPPAPKDGGPARFW